MRRELGTQNTNRAGTAAPRFFTINDIATSLSVSDKTVRRWIAGGALSAHNFNRVVRISERDFLAFLALHRQN